MTRSNKRVLIGQTVSCLTLGVRSHLGDPQKDTATPAKKVEIRVTNANYRKPAR